MIRYKIEAKVINTKPEQKQNPKVNKKIVINKSITNRHRIKKVQIRFINDINF